MSDEGRATAPRPSPPPRAYEDQRSQGHGQGWLIVVGLVFAFGVGGLAAAIISKGDDGASSGTPVPSTIVQQSTTTVTTPAPSVTLAPDITLAPDGTPAPIRGGGGEGSDATDTSPGSAPAVSP